MCDEKYLGRFRCRDGRMTRIRDEHPEDLLVPENDPPKPSDPMDPFDPLPFEASSMEEPGTAAERSKRASDAFIAASKKRWAKK
jgi:hypothetical protein